jgi:hypothetical protein
LANHKDRGEPVIGGAGDAQAVAPVVGAGRTAVQSRHGAEGRLMATRGVKPGRLTVSTTGQDLP